MLLTLVYLVPIYWITSTAFKPRSLATTVPPTVLFQPEVTAFIKLFTKRVQMIGQVDPEVYDKAPWWEKRIYDLGERIIKDSSGNSEPSAYPSRFLNSLIVAVSSTILAVAMGTLTAYGFSRFRMPGEQDWLFFILSTRMLPPVVVAIPMFLMYRAVGLVDTHVGIDHPLHRVQPVVLGVADEGLHRRDPQGIRRGRAGRRLHAHGSVFQDRAAAVGDRNRGDRRVLLHNRLERIRLRLDDDQPSRPDGAALTFPRSSDRGSRTGPRSRPAPSCSFCLSRSSPSCCAGTCCAE